MRIGLFVKGAGVSFKIEVRGCTRATVEEIGDVSETDQNRALFFREKVHFKITLRLEGIQE